MTAPTVDQTAAAETTEAPEEVVDLREFNDAVTNAISDGDPGKEELRAVRRVYGTLEARKGKYAARAQVDEDIRSAIQSGNLRDAQALYIVKDALTKGGLSSGGGGSKSAKNPVEAHLTTMASIGVAWSLVQANGPAGADPADLQTRAQALITTDTISQAQEYVNWLNSDQEGDEPDVPEVAKAAARVSLGRAPKGQGRKKNKSTETAAAAPADTSVGDAPEGFVTQ